MKHNEYVLNNLMSVIDTMYNNKNDFVKNPDKDFTRNRKLDFQHTIMLILSMNGNTLNKELYDYFGKDPRAIATSSAFVQQRDKIADGAFEHLFHAFNKSMIDFKTYSGYRLYAVDGSDINIAYNKDSDTYIDYTHKDKKEGSAAVNQFHLNAIYDLMNKVYVDASLQPRSKLDERRDFIEMLKRMSLPSKTIFIADRGYPSWNMFAHFKYKNNADYLIRVRNGENRIIKSLPMTEFDITKNLIVSTNQYDRGKENYVIVQTRKGKQNRIYTEKASSAVVQWDFADKETLSIRIVRFKITDDTYETIITSLPKDKFPLEEIKKLYGMRWGIETSFRELKYAIGLTNLHCKREDFVVQEIFAKLTFFNFTHRIVEMIVVEQDENRKYTYQVNFTMATRICVDFFKALISSADLYELMTKYIVPIRPGRSDKRKMKTKAFVSFVYRVA